MARLPDGFTSGDLEIMRGDLSKLLYEATRNTAEYVFGDSIDSLRQTTDAVEVTLQSGRSRSFDLVVGADGLHSNVRALAFGDESNFVRQMGYYIAIFTVPDFLRLHDAGRYYVQLGKRVGCFGNRNSGNAQASFYFASSRLQYDRRDVAAQKRQLRETFADVKWEAQQMLGMMDAAPDFYFDSLSQVKMDAWSSGRVVLIGDAASCASPMAGMGTSIAMVGAFVLASELKAADGDYATAFSSYQARMRGFVIEAQKMADSVGWFIPRSRLRLWLSGKLWSWMPQATLRELMIEQPPRVASMVALKDCE